MWKKILFLIIQTKENHFKDCINHFHGDAKEKNINYYYQHLEIIIPHQEN